MTASMSPISLVSKYPGNPATGIDLTMMDLKSTNNDHQVAAAQQQQPSPPEAAPVTPPTNNNHQETKEDSKEANGQNGKSSEVRPARQLSISAIEAIEFEGQSNLGLTMASNIP